MSVPGETPKPGGSGRGPVIAVGIAALVLVVLLIPGVLLSIGDGATTARPSEAERQLERQIKEYERQLGEDVCRLSPQTPTLLPPGSGSTPPGEDGGKSAKPGTEPPPYSVPVVPRSAPVPEGVAPGQTARPANLADLLERSTVLVLAKLPNGTSMGTGFFIAPDLVLTNAHVVEGAQRIVVGNKAMQRIVDVRLVASVGPPPIEEIRHKPDYALLKLPAEQTVGYLSFADLPPAKLQNVVAAGYPGIVTESDRQFDTGGLPDLVLTQGAVMVVQNLDDPAPIIVHRASVSRGNSGGPLADECGRVVGVNTSVASGRGADHQNFAQWNKSAFAFLKENGVTPRVVAGGCVVTQAPPAPAPGPGAGPAPPPPPGSTPKPGGDQKK